MMTHTKGDVILQAKGTQQHLGPWGSPGIVLFILM